MTDEQVFQFVKTNAALMGLPADDARVARVAALFKRTESMMQLLDEVQLPSDLEIAEIYNPKQTRV